MSEIAESRRLRVFGLGGRGGSELAIVLGGPGDEAAMVALAAATGAVETAFLAAPEEGALRLRVFAPAGEVGLSVRAALAAAVAVELPLGEAAEVEFARGGRLGVRREDWAGTDRVWVRLPLPGGVLEPLPGLSRRFGGAAVRLAGGRAWIGVELDSPEELAALAPTPNKVLNTCYSEGVEGIVAFCPRGHGAQVRAFTLAASGGEDDGSGAPVAEVGRLLARGGADRLAVVQRPGDPDRESHLTLALGERTVEVGAEVADKASSLEHGLS